MANLPVVSSPLLFRRGFFVMATKKVFYDQDGKFELQAYVNDSDDIYISIDPTESDAYYGGYLTLQKWELKELIEHLNTLLDE